MEAYNEILDLDRPYLNLNDPDIFFYKKGNWRYNQWLKHSQKHNINPKRTNTAQHIQTKPSNNLKKLLKRLNSPQDPRKIRRLQRKQAKLKKKGIKVFDIQMPI